LKKRLVPILKFALPLVILTWLLATVDRRQFLLFWHQDKNWFLLSGGLALTLAAVCVTFLRWYVLVSALGLPFRVTDAFRLGFLCYLLNFVGAGSVGGDLFRALFIAREQPGRRTEAVATVVLDRVIGIYALFILTTAAVLLAGRVVSSSIVKTLCDLTLIATLVGTVVVLLFLFPQFQHGRLLQRFYRLPKIGPVLARVAAAVAVYRESRTALLLAFVMSLAVHGMLALAVFCIAIAIFEQAPTLTEHFIIVPLANVAGAIPITPAGLGTFELATRELYRLVPAQSQADGTIVALTYRLMTIVIAMVGVVYYWFSRREVKEILAEAEEEGRKTKD
jgi:glycosyltransferase 2 family protein